MEKNILQKNGTIKDLIKKHRISIIVIASLLLVSLIILMVTLLTRKVGNTAIVTINGVEVGEYNLSKDGVYSLNGGTNELTVKDGVAYMSASSCPGHDCENWGKVKYVGQSIVCLPNNIVITIVANENSPDADGGVDFVS